MQAGRILTHAFLLSAAIYSLQLRGSAIRKQSECLEIGIFLKQCRIGDRVSPRSGETDLITPAIGCSDSNKYSLSTPSKSASNKSINLNDKCPEKFSPLGGTGSSIIASRSSCPILEGWSILCTDYIPSVPRVRLTESFPSRTAPSSFEPVGKKPRAPRRTTNARY